MPFSIFVRIFKTICVSKKETFSDIFVFLLLPYKKFVKANQVIHHISFKDSTSR